MRSKITSKYQITLPKELRERMNVGVADVLEWRVTSKGVTVEPIKRPFLDFAGTIKTGPGDVTADLKNARRKMAARFKQD